MLAVSSEARHHFWEDELRVTGAFATPGRDEVLIASDSDTVLADFGSPYGRGPGHRRGRTSDVFVRAPNASGLSSEQLEQVFIDATPDYSAKVAALHASAELRRQRAPFTLVTKSDRTVPTGASERAFLDDPRLAAQFATNPSGAPHPKLHGYPAGVRPVDLWRRALSAAGAAGLQPRRERPHLLMAGCVTTATHAQRAAKLAALRAAGFGREPNCSAYHRELLTSRFVASFRGNGANNHRDWEALVSGAIPLVDHHPALVELFAELPVVMVKDWARVTPAALEAIWQRMQTMRFDLRKAYLPHWVWRFREARARALREHEGAPWLWWTRGLAS